MEVEPEAVPGAASRVVAHEDVVWVSDPEAGRSGVSVEQAEGWLGVHDQIVLNAVLGLDGVLDEYGVAHAVVVDVVLDSQVVHTVKRGASVVRLVNGVPTHIRPRHGAKHVEVNGVPTELERLADVEELSVLDAAHRGLVAW